jgi:hypothetical protein
MRIKVCASWILAVSVLAYSTPGSAAQHVVDLSAMRQAVTDQQSARAANQAAVKALLDRQATRELAAELGLDLRRADRALGQMSSEDLARLAASARAVDVDLAGGQSTTIVISTTTVLLLIIILILIVD